MCKSVRIGITRVISLCSREIPVSTYLCISCGFLFCISARRFGFSVGQCTIQQQVKALRHSGFRKLGRSLSAFVYAIYPLEGIGGFSCIPWAHFFGLYFLTVLSKARSLVAGLNCVLICKYREAGRGEQIAGNLVIYLPFKKTCGCKYSVTVPSAGNKLTCLEGNKPVVSNG